MRLVEDFAYGEGTEYHKERFCRSAYMVTAYIFLAYLVLVGFDAFMAMFFVNVVWVDAVVDWSVLILKIAVVAFLVRLIVHLVWVWLRFTAESDPNRQKWIPGFFFFSGINVLLIAYMSLLYLDPWQAATLRLTVVDVVDRILSIIG